MLCKTACSKFHALTRNLVFTEPEKLKLLMKTFVMSQLSIYCPLIWMFHDSYLNNKVYSIHERSLRNAYKDNVSRFKKLLETDSYLVTILQKKVKLLMVESYKRNSNLNPNSMKQIE